jgi:hypothetical protein
MLDFAANLAGKTVPIFHDRPSEGLSLNSRPSASKSPIQRTLVSLRINGCHFGCGTLSKVAAPLNFVDDSLVTSRDYISHEKDLRSSSAVFKKKHRLVINAEKCIWSQSPYSYSAIMALLPE